ncbi:hypothetical protein RFI_20832, partial [Reticulomyxa filosa]
MFISQLSKRRFATYLSVFLLIFAFIQIPVLFLLVERYLHSPPKDSTSRNVVSSDSEKQDFYVQGWQGGKIACLVLTLYPRNYKLIETIGNTWGKHCDGLFWIIDKYNGDYTNREDESKDQDEKDQNKDQDDQNKMKAIQDTSQMNLTHMQELYNGRVILIEVRRPPHPVKRNTWEKVHRMYSYFYAHLTTLHDYDWFVRVDDDVFVNMVALRDYLSLFNAMEYPWYIGHTLLDRWKDNIVYNAGNCYVISRYTLELIAPYFMTFPSLTPQQSRTHCVDFQAGNDDPHFGSCLNALGIHPVNTLDYYLRC